jgi:hypothetical protein
MCKTGIEKQINGIRTQLRGSIINICFIMSGQIVLILLHLKSFLLDKNNQHNAYPRRVYLYVSKFPGVVFLRPTKKTNSERQCVHSTIQHKNSAHPAAWIEQGEKSTALTIHCLTNEAPLGNFCATTPMDERTSFMSPSETN